MPEIKVRLASSIVVIDRTPQHGVEMVTRSLRELFVQASNGIVESANIVELEVDHDKFGWDENIEPLKLMISVPDDVRAREEHRQWRRRLAQLLIDQIEDAGALRAIPTFQVSLIIGSAHSGGSYECSTDKELSEWIDSSLPQGDPTDGFAGSTMQPGELYAGQRFGLPDPWD